MVKVKKFAPPIAWSAASVTPAASKLIGSLLLGLYDDAGLLHHVGFTSAFKTTDKRALTKKFEALRKPPGFTGNAPGGPSRWSTERSGEWEPVDPKVVVEVTYDHFTGDRFRHGTKLLGGEKTKRRGNARSIRSRTVKVARLHCCRVARASARCVGDSLRHSVRAECAR